MRTSHTISRAGPRLKAEPGQAIPLVCLAIFLTAAARGGAGPGRGIARHPREGEDGGRRSGLGRRQRRAPSRRGGIPRQRRRSRLVRRVRRRSRTRGRGSGADRCRSGCRESPARTARRYRLNACCLPPASLQAAILTRSNEGHPVDWPRAGRAGGTTEHARAPWAFTPEGEAAGHADAGLSPSAA